MRRTFRSSQKPTSMRWWPRIWPSIDTHFYFLCSVVNRTRRANRLTGGLPGRTDPDPDPSLAWEDLSAVDRRALTEMLVDKIIIERHPSKIDKDGRRHYLIRAIPYQDPQQEAERLKAVHEARVKIVPRV